jgi:hypothetical protein
MVLQDGTEGVTMANTQNSQMARFTRILARRSRTQAGHIFVTMQISDVHLKHGRAVRRPQSLILRTAYLI